MLEPIDNCWTSTVGDRLDRGWAQVRVPPCIINISAIDIDFL
jgi:hypothetical protein